MYAIIIAIHLIVSLTMILIIIFQSSKGAEMGAVFGGGASQTAFGSSGPQSFLEKVTVICAVIFMLTSLSLAYMSASRTKRVVPPAQMPIEQPMQPAAQPGSQTETATQPQAQTQSQVPPASQSQPESQPKPQSQPAPLEEPKAAPSAE